MILARPLSIIVITLMAQVAMIAYWNLLEPETEALNLEPGARSELNVGAWPVAPAIVGYALSN